MLDFSHASERMIHQQLRTSNVLNPNVLRVIRETPRELFVPPEYVAFAYADLPIPLAHHQQMLLPTVEAGILQALTIKPSDHVLEIGTGTGYFTALLAQCAMQVTSLDIFEEFILKARQNTWLERHPNIHLECTDGAHILQYQDKPYDVIFISAALPVVPQTFLHALAPEGRLVAFVGPSTMQEVILYRKTQEVFLCERLFESCVPPIISDICPKNEFVF